MSQIESIKARLRIGWTKGVYARDTDGKNLATDDPEACQFCLVGAFMREANVMDASMLWLTPLAGILRDILNAIDGTSMGDIIGFNDTAGSLDDIMGLLEKVDSGKDTDANLDPQ